MSLRLSSIPITLMILGECLNRLQLLEALIPVFGIGKGDGFGLEPLMKFVGATLGNANAEVRAAATRITVMVSFSACASPGFMSPGLFSNNSWLTSLL